MSYCKCYQDLVFFIKQRFMRNSLKNFRRTSMKLRRTSHQGYPISHPDFNGGVKISSFKLEKTVTRTQAGPKHIKFERTATD